MCVPKTLQSTTRSPGWLPGLFVVFQWVITPEAVAAWSFWAILRSLRRKLCKACSRDDLLLGAVAVQVYVWYMCHPTYPSA